MVNHVNNGVDRILSGDIILILTKSGLTKIAVCVHSSFAYERQGGEGAKIQYEDGSHQQFTYSDSHAVIVIGHFDKLEDNPLRQLLVWRQKYEN
jgi:hypothetical protein